ncbi:alcohol dehydrogenase catalytic domain-containing protein [Aquamicrobium sp.]|uniref:alcohol dehydrogenase catalytic domain-containing protein n=1 Tax=Aquamicrobium sp. TaxID=1872579 RepID=UPI0033903775
MPQPGLGEILVEVRAAVLNRRDLLMASTATVGADRPIGMEWAGVIVAIGPEVKGVAAWGFGGLYRRRRLCRICRGDARHCFALQDDPDFARAAALLLALMTAHDALAIQGQMEPGATVLIQGASSAPCRRALQGQHRRCRRWL